MTPEDRTVSGTTPPGPTPPGSTPPGSTPPGSTSSDAPDARPSIDPALAELAAVSGVATSYLGSDGVPVRVEPDTVREVLRLLGIDPTDPAAALEVALDATWRRHLPACAVVPAATPRPVVLHAPADVRPSVELELATGGRIALDPPGAPEAERTVDGVPWVARPIGLPADLPLGDHVLHVELGSGQHRCQVVAVPDAVPGPAALAPPARAWGWMVQLYALTSASSWGMGDYADLATLADWSGRAGADVLLVNPLHAIAPTLPVAASPYSPASRRFVSPLYLRPEALPEYARADPRTRAAVDDLAARARREGHPDGLLDRDAVWRAKRAALELLFDVARPDGGRPGPGGAGDPGTPASGEAASGEAVPGEAVSGEAASGEAASGEAGPADAPPAHAGPVDPDGALTDFATWSALAERHGPDWRSWPAEFARPDTPAVAAARGELAGRIAFHRWLQRRSDEQLAAAQAAARAAGMAAGIVHDLAVGVDPGGADAWALQDVLVVGATVGAPPDTFNQHGQDWGLPPWRPGALADAGYAPFRQMVASVLRRGGGLRVDHILGLFRLWWIPAGMGAAHGTYVRYDAESMLGLLALEAARTGAVVVGEDLGTVEPSVARTLARMDVLGSTVLWFEQDDEGRPLPPERYRAATMASVTTHDLPTAAGYLDGEHVRTRDRLGLLGRPVQAEDRAWRAERAGLVDLLRAQGLVAASGPSAEPARDPAGGAADADGADVDGADIDPGARRDIVDGLHHLLVRSPCRIVLAAPGDALGDRFQPNLPGTTDAYPNWRLPVTDAAGEPITIERLLTDPDVARLGRLLAQVREEAPHTRLIATEPARSTPVPGRPEQDPPAGGDLVGKASRRSAPPLNENPGPHSR